MGGHLATLENEEEIIWMKGYRSHHPELRARAWVGGFEKDDKWLWKGEVADSPMITTDWAAGEPNNNGGILHQDCLQLFGDQNWSAKSHWFKFDDLSCDIKQGFICEMINK